MDRNNKYYGLIEKLVKKHRKFPGYEAILEDIIDDVYSHAESVINSIDNEVVITGYLEKAVSTSIITVPKRLNFHNELKHRSITPTPVFINTPAQPSEIKLQEPVISKEEPEKIINVYQPAPDIATPETDVSAPVKANPELVDKMINTIDAESVIEVNPAQNDQENIVSIEELENISVEDSIEIDDSSADSSVFDEISINDDSVSDIGLQEEHSGFEENSFEEESLSFESETIQTEEALSPSVENNFEEENTLSFEPVSDDILNEEPETLSYEESEEADSLTFVSDDSDNIEVQEEELSDDTEELTIEEPELNFESEIVESFEEESNLSENSFEEESTLSFEPVSDDIHNGEPETLSYEESEEADSLTFAPEDSDNIEIQEEENSVNTEEDSLEEQSLSTESDETDSLVTNDDSSDDTNLPYESNLTDPLKQDDNLDLSVGNSLEEGSSLTLEPASEDSFDLEEAEPLTEDDSVGLVEFGDSALDSNIELNEDINLTEPVDSFDIENTEENNIADFESNENIKIADYDNFEESNTEDSDSEYEKIAELNDDIDVDSISLTSSFELPDSSINTYSDTNKSSFKAINYSVFNYTPQADTDKFDKNDIVEKLINLDSEKPSLNIIKIFELKYKQNKTIDQIANLLNISKQDIIVALNEMVKLI